MKTCIICGQPIDPTTRAKKYCSDECRAKAKYAKDRAWLARHPEKPSEYGKRFYKAHTEEVRKAQKENYRKKCIEKLKQEGIGSN